MTDIDTVVLALLAAAFAAVLGVSLRRRDVDSCMVLMLALSLFWVLAIWAIVRFL